MGSFYNQRRGPQGRGVSGCCSSYFMADVYNRSGDLSPEWAISPCWVERQWCGEEDRKSQVFFLCQNSWRLDWKLVSTLETRFVPSCRCPTRKLSCSGTALFLLSNQWDGPSQLPSDSRLHPPAWRYPADIGRELCYLQSCFSSFCCMPLLVFIPSSWTLSGVCVMPASSVPRFSERQLP